MKHLGLFEGIGGFSLAVQRVGGETLGWVEIDEFCQKILSKRFPFAEGHDDVKTFKTEKYHGKIDILTGGYPCQKFSTAARGRNTAEDLSPYMVEIIKKIRPKFVIAENVQRKTIKEFAAKLKTFGYRTTVYRLSAADVGADHKRNRWWCIAHADHESEFLSSFHAKMEIMPKTQNDFGEWQNYARIFRSVNGLSDRLDRHKTRRRKALGNAIIPKAAEIPIQIIYNQFFHIHKIKKSCTTTATQKRLNTA